MTAFTRIVFRLLECLLERVDHVLPAADPVAVADEAVESDQSDFVGGGIAGSHRGLGEFLFRDHPGRAASARSEGGDQDQVAEKADSQRHEQGEWKTAGFLHRVHSVSDQS